jgi:acyl-CoA thioesterase I
MRRIHLVRLGLALGAILLPVYAFFAQQYTLPKLIQNLEANAKQTIVTYGTSLTDSGYSVWPDRLQRLLNAKYPGLASLTNNGLGARDSNWGVDNLQSRVLELRPSAVFIEFSINDAANMDMAKSRQNIQTMITKIRAVSPDCDIFLLTMNPVSIPNSRPQLQDYYQVYRDVAKERSTDLIDIYSAWKSLLDSDPKTFMQYVPDGVHPGAAGTDKIIMPAIQDVLFGRVRIASAASDRQIVTPDSDKSANPVILDF